MRLSLVVFCMGFAMAAQAAPVQGVKGGGPIDITSAELTVSQNQSQAVFKGAVKVVQGSLTLTADALTVDYIGKGKAKSGGSGIQKLVATGNVRLSQNNGAEVATGAVATYTPDAQTLVMTGPRVTLTRGINTLEGDKLVYNTDTGNAKVTNATGPVKARFVPGSTGTPQ